MATSFYPVARSAAPGLSGGAAAQALGPALRASGRILSRAVPGLALAFLAYDLYRILNPPMPAPFVKTGWDAKCGPIPSESSTYSDGGFVGYRVYKNTTGLWCGAGNLVPNWAPGQPIVPVYPGGPGYTIAHVHHNRKDTLAPTGKFHEGYHYPAPAAGNTVAHPTLRPPLPVVENPLELFPQTGARPRPGVTGPAPGVVWPQPVPWKYIGGRTSEASREGSQVGNAPPVAVPDALNPALPSVRPWPGVRPLTRPLVQARAGANTKEAKPRPQTAYAAAQALWLGPYTEFGDLVDGLFRALPSNLQRTGGLGTVGKFNAVYSGFDQLDWSKAVQNIVDNQLEDALVGGALGAAGSVSPDVLRPIVGKVVGKSAFDFRTSLQV